MMLRQTNPPIIQARPSEFALIISTDSLKAGLVFATLRNEAVKSMVTHYTGFPNW